MVDPAQKRHADSFEEWRMCTRKKSYPTRAKANRQARRFDHRVYECPYCFCFHTTKQLEK